jgi:hypothetical protein
MPYLSAQHCQKHTQIISKTHPLLLCVPEDALSLGTGGGGEGGALWVGFRFSGDGDGLFRFPQNGILLFLLLDELDNSACWTIWGGLILLGVAGSFFGGWRGEFDCWLLPPKNSDRPEVLVFKRVPGASPDIEYARNPQAGSRREKKV